MSNNVWNVTQKVKAEDFYNDNKNIYFGILRAGEVYAVKQLTAVCSAMINAYDDIINDQNDYLIEIDEANYNLDTSINEIEQKIEKLSQEIEELKTKVDNGTATEEEKTQLQEKYDELSVLYNEEYAMTDETNKTIERKTQEKKTAYASKQEAATDYAETTIEKGTPLAETKVKGGFFRKLFGTTGKAKKAAGEKAVEVGNNLLDKISESDNINQEIDTRTKH